MSYLVIAPNGQKFGPADLDTLNKWIGEGRIMPDSLLEEAGTGAQLVARAIPGLSFLAAGQALIGTPIIAPPDANPYLTPLPPQHQRQVYVDPAAKPWHYQQSGVSNGQILAAWIGTLAAPILAIFCYFGFVPILFGIITGVQLKRQGENQGIALVAINAIWLIAVIVLRAIFNIGF